MFVNIIDVNVCSFRSQSSIELEYQKKLACMLGYSCIPTKASMKSLIEAQMIVQASSPAVQQLYNLVEVSDIDPLTIWYDFSWVG